MLLLGMDGELEFSICSGTEDVPSELERAGVYVKVRDRMRVTARF